MTAKIVELRPSWMPHLTGDVDVDEVIAAAFLAGMKAVVEGDISEFLLDVDDAAEPLLRELADARAAASRKAAVRRFSVVTNASGA